MFVIYLAWLPLSQAVLKGKVRAILPTLSPLKLTKSRHATAFTSEATSGSSTSQIKDLLNQITSFLNWTLKDYLDQLCYPTNPETYVQRSEVAQGHTVN